MHTSIDACGFGLGQSCHKYNEEDEKEYQYAEYLHHQPSVWSNALKNQGISSLFGHIAQANFTVT